MNQKIIVKVSEIKIGDFLTIFGHRFTVASIEPAKRFGEIVLWNAPIRGNIPAPYLKLAASAEVAVERAVELATSTLADIIAYAIRIGRMEGSSMVPVIPSMEMELAEMIRDYSSQLL